MAHYYPECDDNNACICDQHKGEPMYMFRYTQRPFPVETIGKVTTVREFERLIKNECDTLLNESPSGLDDVEALTEWAVKVVAEWPDVRSLELAYQYPTERGPLGRWTLYPVLIEQRAS